jgi:hypothetical protein
VQDPVITTEGYLFSKEAILQYFLDQKKEKKRQLAEWEAEGLHLQHLVVFHNGRLLWIDFEVPCIIVHS